MLKRTFYLERLSQTKKTKKKENKRRAIKLKNKQNKIIVPMMMNKD